MLVRGSRILSPHSRCIGSSPLGKFLHPSKGISTPSRQYHRGLNTSRLPANTIYRLQRTPRLHKRSSIRTFQRLGMSTKKAEADLVEDAKRTASYQAVAEHFDTSFKYVGIGSGSTIKYVVDAIREQCDKNGNPTILFVPTGFGSRQIVDHAGLISLDFESLPQGQMLDVAFDGTDECDEDFNLIKGGGACLFQEKLVATRAKKFVAVAGPCVFFAARRSCS